MSILLLAPPADLGPILVERLVDQDDEVRVIETEGARGPEWRRLGAHVAVGELDADLIERAAQNTRTVVAFDAEGLAEVLEGSGNADVERLVLCLRAADEAVIDALAGAEMDYVVLLTGRVRRRNLAFIAEAIDAADDLAGPLRVVIDLRREDAGARLRLNEASERPDR